MTENVATMFADRTGWPVGPWDQELDRYEWRDAATGLPCLVSRGPVGSLCGYVGVPPGHPWHGKGYDDVPVEVHGGLTYANKCGGHICHVAKPGEPDDVWWLGFDTGHAWDLSPFMLRYRDRAPLYEEHATYLRDEVTRLARQVADAWHRKAKRSIEA